MKLSNNKKRKIMPIYARPHSVETSTDSYLKVYSSADEAKKRLFNLGAGVWSHPFWTNVDLPPQTKAFAAIQSPCIHHDFVAEAKLPFASNSVDCFYTSHVVEHLPQKVVERLMHEVFRCLRKGGCFRIVTGPDADTDWEALLRGDEKWWFGLDEPKLVAALVRDRAPMTIYDKWLYEVATARSPYSDTPCEKKYTSAEVKKLVIRYKNNPDALRDMLDKGLAFSYKFPGDHVSWWNASKLKKFLKKAGFKTAFRSGYGQSVSPFMRDMRYFDQTFPQMSVYVEGVK
ncbi:MAG: methyltransferase domain-containing protein [Patescibacteria group bacterium]